MQLAVGEEHASAPETVAMGVAVWESWKDRYHQLRDPHANLDIR